jgi:hypothetical protein
MSKLYMEWMRQLWTVGRSRWERWLVSSETVPIATRSYRHCLDCGNVLRGGHNDRKYCTKRDNPDCYRTRASANQRVSRKKKQRGRIVEACPECDYPIDKVITFGPDDLNRLVKSCMNEDCPRYLQEAYNAEA